ncbi:MAG: DEAD/DEAH box helicase family protein [Duncaniella sp.]|nr:DEAD/DEAH box helicase family protein [Duncaniella sp.]HBI57646.1 restriction endonuclease subunit R [Porphyromonadaceae bacterium]
MFYKLIETKRNQWINSAECPVKELIRYIEQKGKMRDAQIESIKTYLFLKLKYKNQALWQLFYNGCFNNLNLDDVPLRSETRRYLQEHPEAAALYEYAIMPDDNGGMIAAKVAAEIESNPRNIDYLTVFRKIFYDVDYADYLFSIPMGAGKTYLMAAFIYINLYFSINEPQNPLFAHNFIVLAPSGLKSSIVPSLKDIRNFDPSWVIPEPSASQLKRLIKFEILEESSTSKGSTQAHNPNVQKINLYQPIDDLFGLVAITNAEKVILDRIDHDTQPRLWSREELLKDEMANELRNLIGTIPNLCIMIDEVHHASEEQQLRKVVNDWTKKSTFNSCIGFSGTPNIMGRPDRIKVTSDVEISNRQLSNVVTYYPLLSAIGNFLKTPIVRHANDSLEGIIDNALREFIEIYGRQTYNDGTLPKLAIFSPDIVTLEESTYPIVRNIVTKYGYNPDDVILKYYGTGNKKYHIPPESKLKFSALDMPTSKIRFILLVQIGKEGWNCRSLASVVLPVKTKSSQNRVLQTSCRCLREVTDASGETALIWMNNENAKILNQQLVAEQNITLQEFGSKNKSASRVINRFSRMEKVGNPCISFIQLNLKTDITEITGKSDIDCRLRDIEPSQSVDSIVYTANFAGKTIRADILDNSSKEIPCSFFKWINIIAKESLGTLPISELLNHKSPLADIFSRISVVRDNITYLKYEFDHPAIRSMVRKAFSSIRSFSIREEFVPTSASLLNIVPPPPALNDGNQIFYPDDKEVEDIIQRDNTPAPDIDLEIQQALELLRKKGFYAPKYNADENRVLNRTYQYLPYHFDSKLEQNYFVKTILNGILPGNPSLEAYFNGDDTLTDFCVKCYDNEYDGQYKYVGLYYPDFVILQRDDTGKISRAVIVETKGTGFAQAFEAKRRYMETRFKELNDNFEFLFLSESLSDEQRSETTLKTIKNFFKI